MFNRYLKYRLDLFEFIKQKLFKYNISSNNDIDKRFGFSLKKLIERNLYSSGK